MKKTYAIGDVHGRADLLCALLSFIDRENGTKANGYRVVFLGDIIDRGPESREAMNLVVETLQRHPDSRLILGNHEEFLLFFLDLPEMRDRVLSHWMRNGGFATAASYGLRLTPSDDINRASVDLLDCLNRETAHVDAMRQAASLIIDNNHILVHAGLRPGTPIDAQTPKDLRTIRDLFLDSDFFFGHVVVHGHTTTKSGRPEVYANRIAIDTGAEHTGKLTALELQDSRPSRFLSATDMGTIIVVDEVLPDLTQGVGTYA